MRIRATCWQCGGLLSLAAALIGCNKTNTTLAPPPVSPASAAAKAIETYDADRDGSLSRKELERSPGLLKALARYDADQDKKISAAEIEARLQKFIDTQLGFLGYACHVSVNGAPIAGAVVELVPEPYLQGMIGGAQGTTDETGIADMNIDASQLPPGVPIGTGVQFGTYQIRVTHPTQKIPPKYNTETELGVEISPIDTQDPRLLQLELKSR